MVTDISEDIEACHKKVMNSFKRFIPQNPSRFWFAADQALFDCCAVEIAKHRQRCVGVVAIAIPNEIQIDLRLPAELRFQKMGFAREILAVEFGIALPLREYLDG